MLQPNSPSVREVYVHMRPPRHRDWKTARFCTTAYVERAPGQDEDSTAWGDFDVIITYRHTQPVPAHMDSDPPEPPEEPDVELISVCIDETYRKDDILKRLTQKESDRLYELAVADVYELQEAP